MADSSSVTRIILSILLWVGLGAALAISLPVAVPEALAVSSLVTGRACTARELYLEDSLAPKPDPAYCPDCKRAAAQQFFGLRDLARDAQDMANAENRALATPLSRQDILPQQCFSAVMSLRPVGWSYHYAACPSEASWTHGPHAAPCVSSSLASSVQSAFQQTMSCLGVNEKEVFPLLGWDSHFQVNLWNGGGVGVGQLTSIAVADVDVNRRFEQDLNKPECKQFEGIFAESAQNYHKLARERGRYPTIRPCEWMAPPDNPAKNLLYAGATYRLDKREAEVLARRIGATPADTDRIATELARYMYNGGLGGVRNVFRLFQLRTHDRNMTISQFTKAFSQYLGTHYEGDDATERTKARVAAYAHHVYELKKQVERITGGNSCSE